jgi:hypothetical protein
VKICSAGRCGHAFKGVESYRILHRPSWQVASPPSYKPSSARLKRVGWRFRFSYARPASSWLSPGPKAQDLGLTPLPCLPIILCGRPFHNCGLLRQRTGAELASRAERGTGERGGRDDIEGDRQRPGQPVTAHMIPTPPWGLTPIFATLSQRRLPYARRLVGRCQSTPRRRKHYQYDDKDKAYSL